MLKRIIIISFLFVFTFLFVTKISFAESETTKVFLEKLPGMEKLSEASISAFKSDTGDFSKPLKIYLNWIINTSVIFGSILAVGLIIFGGVTYMTTDSFSGKSEGKEYIKNAVMGLIFLIAGYLIFLEIDPNILNLHLTRTQVDRNFKVSNISLPDIPNMEEYDPETDGNTTGEHKGSVVSYGDGLKDGTRKIGSAPHPSGQKYNGLTVCSKAFWSDFYYYAQSKGVGVIMAQGFRTAEQQNAIYKKNRPGHIYTHKDGYVKKSKHQSGRAMDIVDKSGYKSARKNRIVGNLLREYANGMHDKYTTRFLGDWDYNHVEVLGCKD